MTSQRSLPGDSLRDPHERSHAAVLPASRTVQRALMASPVVVLLGMHLVFRLPAASEREALLRGFLVYWIACGVVFPLLVVGPRRVLATLTAPSLPGRGLSWRLATLLALPPAIVLVALPGFSSGTLAPALVVYALLNGVIEELYWRGLFVQFFPDDATRGLLYPAVMYAAWLVVAIMASGPWTGIDLATGFGAGLLLGLLYGWVALRTGSIRWTIVSHVLLNLGGVGALVMLGR